MQLDILINIYTTFLKKKTLNFIFRFLIRKSLF